MTGAEWWCGGLPASLWYNDFIALGHKLVGGMSVLPVVSVLFSIISLVFVQSIMNKRVPFFFDSAPNFTIFRGFADSHSTGMSDAMVLVVSDGERIFFSSTSRLFVCLHLMKVHSDIKHSLVYSGQEVLIEWTLYIYHLPSRSSSHNRVTFSCTETYLVSSSFLLLLTTFRGLSPRFFAYTNAFKASSCVFL